MDSLKKLQDTEISLKGLTGVLAKRKKIFSVTFLIVLTVGLLLTFLAGPEYTSISRVTLSTDSLSNAGKLFKYFPVEAKNLWIIPTYEDIPMSNYLTGKFEAVINDVNSEELIDKIYSEMGGEVNKKVLRNSINFSLDRWTGRADIIISSRSRELAYKINKLVLGNLLQYESQEIAKIYDTFLLKLDTEINNAEAKLPVISEQLKKGDASPIIYILKDWELDRYELMLNIRDNLYGNKEFFTNRIIVLVPPELSNVLNTSSFTRDILLSIISALVTGVIVAFIINHYKYSS